MSNTLEQRLKEHSNAFDGLLSLIPAKYYYDDETRNQWNKKRQSKEEARQAKRAKFDPDSVSLASEALLQRQQNAESIVVPPVQKPTQRPRSESKGQKFRKTEENLTSQISEGDINGVNDDDEVDEVDDDDEVNEDDEDEEDESDQELTIVYDDEGNEISDSDNEENIQEAPEISAPKVPTQSSSKSETSPGNSSPGIEELRAKLASKIQDLREKRKAPGTGVNGAPLNREAILEARRKKQEFRQQAEKKENRETSQDEEEDSEIEYESDNELNDLKTNDEQKSNVLFSQVLFRDGDKASADLTDVAGQKRKRGPSDLLGQLRHVRARNSKLAAMDEDKRKAVESKSQWGRAIAQAEGSKVRDDEKLLRKALKRQKKAKSKSKTEWNERKEHVAYSIQARQNKREENLEARREMKNNKGKKPKKTKKRAGFEGRSKSSRNR